MTIRDQNHPDQRNKPEDDDNADHQYQESCSDDDEGDADVQSYEENARTVQHNNQVEVVHQEDAMEDYAYWEWSPRNTMCLLVHFTPEQESAYWQEAINGARDIHDNSIETASSATRTAAERDDAYNTYYTQHKQDQGT